MIPWPSGVSGFDVVEADAEVAEEVKLAVVFGSLAAHTVLSDFVVALLVVFLVVLDVLFAVLDLLDVLEVLGILVWLSELDVPTAFFVSVCVEFTLLSVD